MTSRFDRQMLLRLAVTGGALMALAAAMLGPVAWAQAPAEPARAQREQELEAVRLEQRQAAETEARLKAEVEALAEDRRKLNQALIDTAARTRSVEERIATTESRLSALAGNETTLRRSLGKRRGVIADV